jgi:hypothetical protein
MAWGQADVKCLVLWFNGGCPWGAEFVEAVGQEILEICLTGWLS